MRKNKVSRKIAKILNGENTLTVRGRRLLREAVEEIEQLEKHNSDITPPPDSGLVFRRASYQALLDFMFEYAGRADAGAAPIDALNRFEAHMVSDNPQLGILIDDENGSRD